MSQRRAVLGVMDAGEGASAEALAMAEALGERISARGWVLLTGGLPAGVMAAANRARAVRLPWGCWATQAIDPAPHLIVSSLAAVDGVPEVA